MPIYEFFCQSCGNEFEQIQSFSDSSVPACAKCGSTEVVRRMGRPAIHFKGSGWYITDSKKGKGDKNGDSKGVAAKSNGEAGVAESGGGSATEGKSDGVGESKVETKAEPKTETKSASSTESKSAPALVASD